MSADQSQNVVLSRYLAEAGVASRRASIDLIRAGDITVNGTRVVDPGSCVNPASDTVCYRGSKLKPQKKRYFLLHKPRGYACTLRDKYEAKLVLDLFDPPVAERIYPVGRLDRESEGLLLLTNDGDWAHTITHPSFQIGKSYRVDVIGKVQPRDLAALRRGVKDRGDLLRARSARILKRRRNGCTLRIITGDGKNREVRRMCSHFGYQVTRLVRTAVGPIRMGRFIPGYYRELSASERQQIWQSRDRAAAKNAGDKSTGESVEWRQRRRYGTKP